MQLPFPGVDDIIGDLERLAKLRDSGVLTQAEFDAQKARLLGGTPAPAQSPAVAVGVAVTPSACPGCGAPLQLDAAGRCVYCQRWADTGAGAPTAATDGDALADSIARAYPDKEIMAIKELRAATGLGLKEAKDQIEAAYRRVGIRR